jgi:hypothetical protein
VFSVCSKGDDGTKEFWEFTQKIHVTVSINELFCDDRMPNYGGEVERRSPILILKIDVTVSDNELFRDDSCPFTPARCVPMLRLKVDVYSDQ